MTRRKGFCAGRCFNRRIDAEIFAAAEHALRCNAVLLGDKVRLAVEGAWITLSGDVEWDHQRRAAYDCVQVLPGIVGVTEEIVIRARPTGIPSRGGGFSGSGAAASCTVR